MTKFDLEKGTFSNNIKTALQTISNLDSIVKMQTKAIQGSNSKTRCKKEMVLVPFR